MRNALAKETLDEWYAEIAVAAETYPSQIDGLVSDLFSHSNVAEPHDLALGTPLKKAILLQGHQKGEMFTLG